MGMYSIALWAALRWRPHGLPVLAGSPTSACRCPPVWRRDSYQDQKMTSSIVVAFPKTITYQGAAAAHLFQTSLHRAAAVLDSVSEAGDRIEVLAGDSHVGRLAGIMA